MANAKTTPKRLAELQDEARHPAAAMVAKFVDRMARELRERNWPRAVPREKFLKCVGAYGQPELEAQLALIGYNVGEAIALATKRAAKRWPENFGPVTDWDPHRERTDALRGTLEGLYAEMRRAYSAADLVHDTESVTPSDRDKGLVRVVFRRAPNLHLGMVDWPQQVVERARGEVRGD